MRKLLAAVLLAAACLAQDSYQEGVRLLRNQDPKAAAAQLELAVKSRPDFEEARLALALAYQQTGRVDEALVQCEAVIRRFLMMQPLGRRPESFSMTRRNSCSKSLPINR